MSRTAIQRQSPGVEFVYIYIYIYMCTRLYGKRKGEREREMADDVPESDEAGRADSTAADFL